MAGGDQRFQADYTIQQLLQEAQTRWLKPAEICEILNHHQHLAFSETAPIKPLSGSLFLFDRNKLRYFRKDGHNWRKKRDGKTVREAHEKLKVGNKDAIHCYYAHGEDNSNFQRRSYWLLEGGYEHIVLVHYLEVTQSNRNETSPPTTFQGNPAQCFSHVDPIYGSNSDYFTPSLASSPSEMISTSQEGPFDLDSGDDLEDNQTTGRGSQEYQGFPLASLASTSTIPAMDRASRLECNQTVNPYTQGSRKNDIEDGLDTSIWSTLLEGSYGTENNSTSWIAPSTAAEKSIPTSTYQDNLVQRVSGGLMGESPVSVDTWSFENYSDMGYAASVQNGQEAEVSAVPQRIPFDKSQKIEHLSMVHNSYSTSQEVQATDKGLLSPTLSMVMRSIQSQESTDTGWADGSQASAIPTSANPKTSWADTIEDQLGVSGGVNLADEFSFNPGANSILPQRQCFKIVDFAPEWLYAFEETKVLVTGVFLGSARYPNTRWSCVFGEVKVPAEVLESGALRCIAPALVPGKVPFYVANSDGLACSHVQELEYRRKSTIPLNSPPTDNPLTEQVQELLHQVRLAGLLLARDDEVSWLEVENGDLPAVQKQCEKIHSLVANQNIWKEIEDLVTSARHPLEDAKAMLVQEFIKSALHKWLQRKLHGKRVSPCDKHRTGVLHMVAALGYKWAIAPILAADVGVNSRDEHGWTALHWAAFCGREEVIAQLLAAGAAPGALTDPTPSDPTGRTASDLAASSGHNGIAGYLGEAMLTSHLSSLNLHEGEMNKASAVAVDEAVEVMSEKSIVQASLGLTQDELSLRDSLAAVRNASQAEARITATFRAYSFQRRRDLEEASVNEYGMLEEEAQAFAAAQRAHPGHHEKTNLAAMQIQCKYRGWKARNEFLNLKKHVVKIQAHVRGHQARKKYKKIVWTVSMLDKVILRWRRKGSGLRGFKAETMEDGDSDDDSYLKDFRKQKEAAFGEAVSRVKQMIQNPDARSQYRRMLEIYQKEKGAQCEKDIVIPDDDELIGLLG